MEYKSFQARYASSILVTRSTQETPANSVEPPLEADRSAEPVPTRMPTQALRWLYVVALIFALTALLRPSNAGAAIASCYGPGLWGNHTANGTLLTRSTLGAAHKTLPFGTRLYVRSGGVTARVTIIDRGPFVAGRTLDLTEATARQLGHGSCASWGHRNVRSWRAR